MGNLVPCSRKTHPSERLEDGKCDAIQEVLSQGMRNHGAFTLEMFLRHCPNAVKGGSAIPSLLANNREEESCANSELRHHVDSETRGQKKHRGAHQQIVSFQAMQGKACCIVNIPERFEAWLPERHPQHLLQVRCHSASSVLHECIRLQTFHVIPLFVRDGINIDETDTSGLTALHLASKTLGKKAIQTLLRCGANVNLTDPKTGRSALHFATQASSSKGGIILAAGAECVQVLLRNGADVRVRDRDGKEAIHFACQGGRDDLVTLLLDHGADVNSLTNLQESPLFLFLEEKTNLRQAPLLDKLLSLTYPLKLINSEGCLPKGLLFPCTGRLRYALLKITSDVLSLQEICKFNIKKKYGEKMKPWLEKKLPTDLWKSIYVGQEFSYTSKMKALN